jgi:hypothetical protein
MGILERKEKNTKSMKEYDPPKQIDHSSSEYWKQLGLEFAERRDAILVGAANQGVKSKEQIEEIKGDINTMRKNLLTVEASLDKGKRAAERGDVEQALRELVFASKELTPVMKMIRVMKEEVE